MTIEHIRPDPIRPQGYEEAAGALRAVVESWARETQQIGLELLRQLTAGWGSAQRRIFYSHEK